MASDQRERRREGSRRAQAARQRRMEARARRKNKNILYGVSGLVVVIAAIVGFVLLQGDAEAMGYEVPELPGLHSPPYNYVDEIQIDGQTVRIPPTSGNHVNPAGPYGFLGSQIVPEAAVHNMEHGAIVIWYKPGDAALAGQINALINEVGRECLVAGAYEDMSFEVAATLWSRVLPQETYDEAELKQFIAKYRGEGGPAAEAGLCRQQS